jgi:hypothetical protein
MLALQRNLKYCDWKQVDCSDHVDVDVIDGKYDKVEERGCNKVVMFLRKFTRKYKRPKYLVKPKRDY